MDSLLKPFVFLFFFWWATLYLLFGIWEVESVLGYLLVGLLASGLGAAAGLLMTLLHRRFVLVAEKLEVLQGESVGAVRTSLGFLPGFIAPPMARLGEPRTWVPADMQAWWASYVQHHPAHALAFKHVVAMMRARPVPASPYPGGHGGATLEEHSWNVVRTLLSHEIKPYTGMYNKSGKLVFDLLDSQRRPYQLKKGDPILPLCAFAHDIGKLSCYEVQEDGSVLEIKPEHDTEGKRLLARLSSWRKLGLEEYQRALICVGWYHKPLSLPMAVWIDDRARALLSLIHEIDDKTSNLEGQGVYARYILRPCQQSVPMPTAQAQDEDMQVEGMSEQIAPDASLLAESGFLDEVQAINEGRTLPRQAAPSPAAKPDKPAVETVAIVATVAHEQLEDEPEDEFVAPPAKETGDLASLRVLPDRKSVGDLADMDDDDVIENVGAVLLQPGALQYAAGSTKRVGYKYGSWLYLRDLDLNEAVRTKGKGFPAGVFDRGQGQRSQFTKRLLLALSNRGALKQEHGGKWFGHATALFFIGKSHEETTDAMQQASAAGTVQTSDQYVIICRAFAFSPTIFNLKSIKTEPRIVKAVFDNHPLSDGAHIARLQRLAALWREPMSDLDKREAGRRAKAQELAATAPVIERVAFDLHHLNAISSEEMGRIILRDAQGVAHYRIDLLQDRFLPPEQGFEQVEIDGVQCWRSTKKPGKRR